MVAKALPVIPAKATAETSRGQQIRRPRASGDPEPTPGLNRRQATEIPRFPLSRERPTKDARAGYWSWITASFAGRRPQLVGDLGFIYGQILTSSERPAGGKHG